MSGDPDRSGSGGAGSEDAVVARIARAMARASGPPPSGTVWIGDDAAVVKPPDGQLLLATDAVVAGVHADLSVVGVDDLGWKAMTATVSDLCAMGGRPSYALVTACLPRGTDVDRLAAGVAEASAHWHCPVVGGDVTAADQLMVSVAAVGVLDGDAPAVTRSGASAGDALMVTGPLGGSAAGLRLLTAARAGAGAGDPTGGAAATGAMGAARAGAELVAAHRRPMAKLAEGVAARTAGATAMIDVSDGLSTDLHRLADASRIGFRLDWIPVAEGATEAEALGGGEDYELVVAAPDAARVHRAFADAGLRPPVVIGKCVNDPAVRTLRSATLPRTGWEHRLG